MSDFFKTKSQFYLPKGIIYLDGNSLGPLPKKAQDRIQHTLNYEWGEMLVTGWNKAGWMDQPNKVGDRIAKLIGATSKTITVGDTLSIKVFQALASATNYQKNRKVLLTDSSNFPSDIYAAQGLVDMLQDDHQVKIVSTDDLIDNINENVAAVFFTEVDYKTGRRYDAKKIIKAAKQNGSLVILDLAHSAGAIDTNLTELDVDLAVGCTYKYLNGGPGSPAFIYVAPKYINEVEPALFGWHGHKSPFDFSLSYEASIGIDKMRIGSPSIISFSALRHSLDIWEDIDLSELRKRSIVLSELFISELDKLSLNFKLACPRDPNKRGGQISYICENGYEFMQAFIGKKLIGDFRAPNLIRFGFSPLYLDENDILKAIKIIDQVSKNELWKNYKNINRKTVT